MPDLISVCVCPPQISMIVHGRVTDLANGLHKLAGHRPRCGTRRRTSRLAPLWGIAYCTLQIGKSKSTIYNHSGCGISNSLRSSISRRYSNTLAASCSSTLLIAKPTWTTT